MSICYMIGIHYLVNREKRLFFYYIFLYLIVLINFYNNIYDLYYS